MNNYVFVFDYGRDWMIILYKSNNDCDFYNSAEDDWDKTLDRVDDFLKNGGNKYYYNLPNYNTLENIDVFKLKNEPIKELEQYLSIQNDYER